MICNIYVRVNEGNWSFHRITGQGPSKNYVTARGGEGVDNFVTYCYVYFLGEGGIS